VTDNDELVRQDLSLIFEVVKNKLAAFFVSERAKGNLSKRADAERMAELLHCLDPGRYADGQDKKEQRNS
jgi:hypothetical protein